MFASINTERLRSNSEPTESLLALKKWRKLRRFQICHQDAVQIHIQYFPFQIGPKSNKYYFPLIYCYALYAGANLAKAKIFILMGHSL